MPETIALTRDYITPEQELVLIGQIEDELADGGDTDAGMGGRTRLRRYGWGIETRAEWIRDIPTWLPWHGDSIVLNEYQPGSFIGAHIDPPTCDDMVNVLSIGCEAVMTFRLREKSFALSLPPRSLLAFSGDARWNWTHEVEPVARLRYSVVWRTRR